MSKLILATHNKNKANEIIQILSELNVDISNIITSKYKEPIENGISFEENAFIKAKYVYEKSGGIPTLADDSGIIVDILGNAPGIFSARWGGLNATGKENALLLLEQLKDVKLQDRSAKFVTAVVLYIDPKNVIIKFGEIKGFLTTKIQGNMGFGYDPVLIPDGYNKTIAQLSANEKNKISHRRCAIEKIVLHIKKLC
jgi:XTP/dITP diphosphohydrolase